MTDSLPLAYRAMTSENPTELWERVKEACAQGYERVCVNRLEVQSLLDPIEKTTLFMRLVIDPNRVKRVASFFVVEDTRLVHGDTSQSFCIHVSNLITEEGWKLHGFPILYFQSGKPGIRQMLCR